MPADRPAPAPVSLAIDSIVKRHLHPRLKVLGFRKQGQRFWRQSSACVQVLEIQRDKYNRGASGTFTANLGVYFPELVNRMRELPRLSFLTPPARVPAEQNCQLRERLGVIAHEADRWWPVRADTDLDVLGAQFADTAIEHGVAWLDRRATLAGCLDDLHRLAALGDWLSAVYLLFAGASLADARSVRTALPRVLDNFSVSARDRRDFREFAKPFTTTFDG